MTREAAYRKWRSLRRMTVERGCTEHEARTAARLGDVLDRRFGFTQPTTSAATEKPFDDRFARAERHAAQRFNWEYRRCGKKNCRCAGRAAPRHGPYRYGKRRVGRKVNSIYIGR